MKNKLIFLAPAIALLLFVASCSKEDTQEATAVGTWNGTGQYGTAAGDPTYVFSLTFKADGTVNITGNNNSGPDVATGTWAMVQDSVQALYSYSSGSAIYTLSGKYSASSNVMVGTIGLGGSTTGVGLFSVTRQ